MTNPKEALIVIGDEVIRIDLGTLELYTHCYMDLSLQTEETRNKLFAFDRAIEAAITSQQPPPPPSKP